MNSTLIIAALDAAMDSVAGTTEELDLEEAVYRYLNGYDSLEATLAAAAPFPTLRAALRAHAEPARGVPLKLLALNFQQQLFQSAPRFVN